MSNSEAGVGQALHVGGLAEHNVRWNDSRLGREASRDQRADQLGGCGRQPEVD